MKSGSYGEKNNVPSGADAVSFPNSGIKTRIEQVASLFDSRKQAAESANVALSSLMRWISGEGMPAFNSLALLASAKGVSLDWIASGKGHMFAGVQPQQSAEDLEDIYAYVPLYDARISQGHGAWTEGARVLTMLAFTKYSLRKDLFQPTWLRCV